MASPVAVDGRVALESPFDLLHGFDRDAAGRQAPPNKVPAVGHRHNIADHVEHSDGALRSLSGHRDAQGNINRKRENEVDYPDVPPLGVLDETHLSPQLMAVGTANPV